MLGSYAGVLSVDRGPTLDWPRDLPLPLAGHAHVQIVCSSRHVIEYGSSQGPIYVTGGSEVVEGIHLIRVRET